MPEPANTSPSQTSQSQQSSPLPEAQETQETPKTQGSQPTHEPSAHQEEQPLAKPKITREEIAQRPLNKRAVITIGAAFSHHFRIRPSDLQHTSDMAYRI